MALEIVTTAAALRERVAQARKSGKTIGFVPTMGALHEGHGRLVEVAASETAFVVVSIFVNPTQFGPNEDYGKYPRTIEADRDLCEAAGAHLIFAPTVSEMYPSGGLATFVEVPGPSGPLEGASRPGHFRGVATVVLKLFNMVLPDLAFFGAKDFQQQLVIRKMTADLDLPLTVRVVPTVREPDGLAMSSRNRYLNPEERAAAVVLSRALNEAKDAVASGERDADRIRQILASAIESQRLARLDYAEVADAETLERLVEIRPGQPAVALLAVRIGPARLIDNAILAE